MNTKKKFVKTVQDTGANFRDADGQLYLVRCYNCGGIRGKENYAMAVSSGTCAWCGWKDKENE